MIEWLERILFDPMFYVAAVVPNDSGEYRLQLDAPIIPAVLLVACAVWIWQKRRLYRDLLRRARDLETPGNIAQSSKEQP